MAFFGIEKVVPCFTRGTRIATPRGEVLVEDLWVGYTVYTRDHGAQVLRWVGRRDLSLADLIVSPQLRPVRIAKGALGQGLPLRDMKVSPQHRMLIERVIDNLGAEQQAELTALFPDLMQSIPVAARHSLRAHEAKVLLQG